MKKGYLLIIFFIITGVMQAQLLRGAGIKAGLTIANQEWDYPSVNVDPDSRAGFNLGVFAEFLDMPVISAVGEINYVQKGLSNLETLIAEEALGGDIRLNYLNFTALGKLRVDFLAFSPYFVAGPKLDIELSRSAIANSFIVSNFSKERLGFKIGIGTELHTPSLSFLIEILYDSDFNELYNNNSLTVDTRSYDLRVGIMF
jgi:hypothetical protein